jgi:hypothetical protein
VQVSFSQGRAEDDVWLIGVMGVVGVAGVPVDRFPRLPQPKREVVVDEGDASSSIGGLMGSLLFVSKQ